MASILEDFAAAVIRHPDRTAIVDGKGSEVTFAQLKARAEGFARAWVARGIQRGDRVLLAMAFDADLYASLAALWSIGATVVLPEPAMGIAGLRYAARATNVSAFCSSGAYGLLKFALPELWGLRHLRPTAVAGALLDMQAPVDDEIALISFTSGTTGAPKALPRSHAFLTAQHHAIAPMLHSTTQERDLVAFPVFVLINIASGQTSVLPNWKMSRLAKLPAAKLGNWITSQSITRALLPPSIGERLAGTEISAALHTVFMGGGPVFPDIVDALTKAKVNLRVVCVYGSTEVEPIAHMDATEITREDHDKMTSGKGLLVGRPVDGLDVRIVADEIQVAGKHVNSGYLNPAHDSDNKVRDGAHIWHRTGDAGYFDGEGRLWLLGRAGSQVSVAGAHIFPFSIETAARQWEGVSQCALISLDGHACLVIEGDVRQLEKWQSQADSLNIQYLNHIAKIPMDRRHASKVDRSALIGLMTSR